MSICFGCGCYESCSCQYLNPTKGLPRKWKMKDGTKIWIKDMETSHIQNCIKMIERQVDAHNMEVWSFDADGYNPRYHEIDLTDPESYPIHTALVIELKKRGL